MLVGAYFLIVSCLAVWPALLAMQARFLNA